MVGAGKSEPANALGELVNLCKEIEFAGGLMEVVLGRRRGVKWLT